MGILEDLLQMLSMVEICLIASVLLVFIILAFFCDRTRWIWLEVAAAMSFGISFLAFPERVLRVQMTSEPNDKSAFVARLYGTMLLCSGLTFFRTVHTRDATVPITLIMSRVCMGSTLLVAQFFSYFNSAMTKVKTTKAASEPTDTPLSPWSDKFLPLFVLPTALWMLGNLIHLWRSHDFNTYPQHNNSLNNHLRIDAWLMLLTGITLLAFPRQILNGLFATTTVPKEVTLHIARSIGAVCLCESVISLQAPGFLHNRDKFVLFWTRLISVIFVAGLLCSGWFVFDLLPVDRLYYAVPLLFPVSLNALVGLITDTTTLYVVQQTPGKPAKRSLEVPASTASDGKKVE
jgi:hypothetical protein